MTVTTYDMEVREIAHCTDGWGKKHIIINQSYWYPADKYTEEEAVEKFMKRKEKNA